MTVVVAAEPLEEVHHEPTVLRGAVGELVSVPMVFTRWDENVLVNIERSGQSLDENVDEIIVAVGTVMKIDTEGSPATLVSGEYGERRAHERGNSQS